MFVTLEQAHLTQLSQRFPEGRVAPLRTLVDSTPTLAAEAGILDPAGGLDQFVQRCIGTVLELEEHQERGGAVLLAYPDGTYREMHIDSSRHGGPLPTATSPLSAGLRRRIRRGAQ